MTKEDLECELNELADQMITNYDCWHSLDEKYCPKYEKRMRVCLRKIKELRAQLKAAEEAEKAAAIAAKEKSKLEVQITLAAAGVIDNYKEWSAWVKSDLSTALRVRETDAREKAMIKALTDLQELRKRVK